jgi:polyisoprenoid-binding protein YceI
MLIRGMGAATAAFVMLTTAPAVAAQTRPINLEKSTLTVLVYKSGLFSAFADDHVVRAPIANGSLSEDVPLSIEIAVRAASLKVLDPKVAESRRSEIQARMLSPEVLDAEKYADITFVSTAVVPAGPDKWTVTGQLTIHGQTRTITFPVTRQDGTYRGTVPVAQRDFGISPISIGGGTVKVKDEVKVQFEIVP